MFDLSSEFNKFYKDNVVLSAEVQHDLRQKKDLNIERLKSGLDEYNDENGTFYKIAETRVQGSMAMYTAVQNDSKDYDIDIAVVFEADAVSKLTAVGARKMVADALSRKTATFAESPEVKHSCVRLKYSEGYHIDIAVFKRYKDENGDDYIYEHAGTSWTIRDIDGIEKWFASEKKDKGDNLRKIVRLSKMFCKSRADWNMPGGLVQTVLCNEGFDNSERLDEAFYNVLVNILGRLNASTNVSVPVDGNRCITPNEADKQRVEVLKNKIEDKLKCLEVLFDANCTKSQAYGAWYEIFYHDYWNADEEITESASFIRHLNEFTDTEEFIDELYDMRVVSNLIIRCSVYGKGLSSMPLHRYLESYSVVFGRKYVPHDFTVNCEVENLKDISYDKLLWKVRNVGKIAELKNDIRGQILDRGVKITEHTRFNGPHYIECYAIKDNVCIAVGYVGVTIGGNDD